MLPGVSDVAAKTAPPDIPVAMTATAASPANVFFILFFMIFLLFKKILLIQRLLSFRLKTIIGEKYDGIVMEVQNNCEIYENGSSNQKTAPLPGSLSTP